MRVNDTHATSCVDILRNQVLKQRGLSDSGLADNVEVPTAILLPDTDKPQIISVLDLAERRFTSPIP